MDKQIITDETIVDIASLSFTVDRVEQVGMAKIYSKPYKNVPDAYSVSWNEWVKDKEGLTVQAEKEPQTSKITRIQRFESYEASREFFLKKIEEISKSYKENEKLK